MRRRRPSMGHPGCECATRRCWHHLAPPFQGHGLKRLDRRDCWTL